MVAIADIGRLSAPPFSVIAGAVGGGVAMAVAALPATILESMVSAAGLPSLIAGAAPPIGFTGRCVLALGVGALVAAAILVALLVRVRRIAPGDAPVLRRADAHPDAPSRRPIRASEDLGPPLPIAVPSPAPRHHEQALPGNLDLPLAAFDPGAVPSVPVAPIRPVKPLAARAAMIDPGERFETFALPAVAELPPAPVSPVRAPREPAEPTTIAALLDRLERSAQRRPAARRASVDIDATLGMLRGLATG